MNDRHRQIEKAKRMLDGKKTPRHYLVDFLTGVDWEAFGDAISAAAQCFKELADRAAEAFRDFKPTKLAVDAILAEYRANDKEGTS